MKSSIKLVLPLVFLMSVLAIAQETNQMPPTPPGVPGDQMLMDADAQPPENESNMPARDPEHQRPMGMEGQKIRHDIQQRENELLTWLGQNDPNKANELKALKEKDQRAYNRRMMFEMKNYWGIMEAQQSNPALAEVLKKDMTLKQKRNELLEQIKSSKDQAKKADLTQQLKDVLGQRFDLIVQKKQLRYEDLKKRLEELQQDVKKSQAELETIKDKKEQQVQQHLEQLLNRSEEIDWN